MKPSQEDRHGVRRGNIQETRGPWQPRLGNLWSILEAAMIPNIKLNELWDFGCLAALATAYVV